MRTIMTLSIALPASELATKLDGLRSIAAQVFGLTESDVEVVMRQPTADDTYAAYQSILAAETAAYHAWLDAGGHDEPGNETLFATMDTLTEARVAKFEEWAKLASK